MQTQPRNLIPLIVLAAGGCAQAPTLDVFGSYFPAWMACMVAGIIATAVVRLLLIAAGVHPYLRAKLLVYPCLMVCLTLIAWLIFFRN